MLPSLHYILQYIFWKKRHSSNNEIMWDFYRYNLLYLQISRVALYFYCKRTFFSVVFEGLQFHSPKQCFYDSSNHWFLFLYFKQNSFQVLSYLKPESFSHCRWYNIMQQDMMWYEAFHNNGDFFIFHVI